MPDYYKSKIYALKSYTTDEIYIGSTTQQLCRRLTGHKTDYKRFLNNKKPYITSFKIVKYEDCYIELIEKCPCNDKEELHKIEGKYIREMECVNRCIAGRNKKQYYQDNQEQKKQYSKQYYQDNQEKQKQYYQDNKEKITEQKKQYYNENKEKLTEYGRQYSKQYHQKNKEEIKNKKSEKIMCECGVSIRRDCLERHKTSNKHFDLMNIYVV